MSHAPRRRIWRFALLAVICLPIGAHSAERPTPLSRLARLASGLKPRIAPRLSISPSLRSSENNSESATVDLEVTTMARAASGQKPDAGTLHVAGLIDLLWADSAGVSAGRAVASLQAAARVGTPSAALLADLSAAHIARADLTRTAIDYFAALEAADSALSMEATNASALYNRALALDRLALDSEAEDAWLAVTAADGRSAWGVRARGHLESIAAARAEATPSPAALAAELAAFALREPQEARLLATNQILGVWGEAVLRGDSAHAADRLAAAAGIASALERRRGDRSVSDEVAAIRASRSRREARRLAGAYVSYARAHRAWERRSADEARLEFEAAHASAGASPVLRAWSRYFQGVMIFYSKGRPEPIFREVHAAADTMAHPALAARARWSLGTLMLRRGAFQEAHDLFAGAARLFDRAGEREHLGAVRYLRAEALLRLGDEEAAYGEIHRALHTLRPYRKSTWLHNLLYITSEAVVARGMRGAGLRLQDEGVAVAARGRPALHAEALLARARARVAFGDSAGARRDIDESWPLLRSLQPGEERSWHEADARLTAAFLTRDPGRAGAFLDSVVSYFEAKQITVRLLPALTRRAEVRFAAGRPGAAIADLDSAALLLDEVSADVRSAVLRASILNTARGLFDRLVLAHVHAGRNVQALAELERGRASFGSAPAPRSSPVHTAPAAPPGQTAVEYAFIGDTLLAFVIRGKAVHLTRVVTSRDTLLRRVESARLVLERPALADSARADLAALYDVLIRPVRSRLGPGEPLVVVADGDIAAVPFAALLDSARNRFLVQDHTLRFASTLRDAERVPPPGRGAALFVADPAFDRRDHPDLQRLPETAAGIRAIASAYPGATLLADAAADPAELAGALGAAGLFHFAGHAVFDDARPDRSYLVLAPGRDGRARLTARDIERIDLRGTRLVVLSACQTQRAGRERSSGFAGLSGAILAAGAGGVVGSLWRVDDGLTRALMAEFHHAYRASSDGAGALRAAQLKLLGSADPALRSPAAWAGFRYAGG